MTLNGVMAATLRYFINLVNIRSTTTAASICGGIYVRVLYSVVRVRCRRKESLRSLSHLLMSFLFMLHWYTVW